MIANNEPTKQSNSHLARAETTPPSKHVAPEGGVVHSTTKANNTTKANKSNSKHTRAEASKVRTPCKANIAGMILVGTIAIGTPLLLTGCNASNNTPSPTANVSISNNAAKQFLTGTFKIRSEVQSFTVPKAPTLIFEVYVNGDGNGTGLLGYNDTSNNSVVNNVYLSSGKVYVELPNAVYIELTDITARLTSTSTAIAEESNLTDLGFTVQNSTPVQYKFNNDEINILTKYRPADFKVEAKNFSQENPMTVETFIKKIVEEQATSVSVASSANTNTPSTDDLNELGETSFYANSTLGININGKLYSCGDFCSPYDYFEALTPSGIVPHYVYKEDKKVALITVSYASSNGQSQFMLTDKYVQSIYTTSPFDFHGIKSGITEEELKQTLGIDLDEEEQAAFRPLVKGMTYLSDAGNEGYTFKLPNDLTIEFRIGDNGTLSSILETRNLDFLNDTINKED